MISPDRPKLMVVDDEPDVLRSVHDLFRMDYRVLTYTRPSDALAALRETDVPVIMSDQRMPEMSGVEFLRRAAAVRPDATRLLFTGYSDIKAVVAAINEGNVFRYVSKPWNHDELATIIRQAFRQHALIVERRSLVDELTLKNAQLIEADRLKGAFIEVASHELNTPVAVILGLTELWKMSQAETASAAERAWIERIHRAGRRLAGVVDRMLKLLHAEEFDRTLTPQPTDLGPMIQSVVADLRPFLEARRQTVDLDLDLDLGAAEIDPGKVGDVLTNLLVNAIKFTPDGGTIRLEAGPDGADAVRVRVSDPGVGIKPADRRHLFEPFFTGFDTLHHSSGEYQFGKRGIGLGLCLVKKFVELHGGTVEVASTPNQGSTFGFTLPRSSKALRAVG